LTTTIETNGQAIITKNDSIPFGQDSTAILYLHQYRGNIYWQQSIDKENWFTSNLEECDSLFISFENDVFYRAKIIEGSCNPIYSDTIQISIADSLKKAFENNLFLNSGLDSLYVTIEFISTDDTVICELIGGDTVYQGDIILTQDQIQLFSTLKGATKKGINLWPNNTVYYTIPEDLKGDERITQAIENWKTESTPKSIIVFN
jgi:hypothetical protein